MSEPIHVLAQKLFGKSSIDECSLEEIKNLSERHPYFAPAQFLLLEKLKLENASEHSAQQQKAVLYYHDPLQFEYFISSDRFHTEIDFEETERKNYEAQNEKYEVRSTKSEVSEPIAESENVEDSFVEKLNAIENSSEENIDKSNQTIPEETAISTSESETLNEPQTTNHKPQTDFLFEPYHTVDYFASQGIKLSQEEVPKDKFGKQLKSFTEWLKTMKRLPAKEITSSVDAGSEKKVQHLAEDSVHDAEIVTEAMAEVWVKQGNIPKALEVYNKLSLLNPSKNAYFAALIENLKHL